MEGRLVKKNLSSINLPVEFDCTELRAMDVPDENIQTTFHPNFDKED